MVDTFIPTHLVKIAQILTHLLLQHEQQSAVIIKVLTFIVISLSASNRIFIRTGLLHKISYIFCAFHSTIDHHAATESLR